MASQDARFAAPGGQGGWFCHTPMVAIARNVGRKRTAELASAAGTAVASRAVAASGMARRTATERRTWSGRMGPPTGAGKDTVSYEYRLAPVSVSIDDVANDGATAEGDFHSDEVVERLGSPEGRIKNDDARAVDNWQRLAADRFPARLASLLGELGTDQLQLGAEAVGFRAGFLAPRNGAISYHVASAAR